MAVKCLGNNNSNAHVFLSCSTAICRCHGQNLIQNLHQMHIYIYGLVVEWHTNSLCLLFGFTRAFYIYIYLYLYTQHTNLFIIHTLRWLYFFFIFSSFYSCFECLVPWLLCNELTSVVYTTTSGVE